MAALRSVHPSLVTMKANTVLCLVPMGAALWLLVAVLADPVRLWAGLVRAAPAALVGLLTLGEYVSGPDLHAGQLLFR